MKRFSAFVLLLALLLSLSPVASGEPAQEITVSAAISLKKAFEEIGKLYEAQIKGGAPVDVFASAALKDMVSELDFVIRCIDKEGEVVLDTVVPEGHGRRQVLNSEFYHLFR